MRMPTPPLPPLTVVVVSYNTRADLLHCLSSLRAHAPAACEIVVVDNASDDGSAAAVRAGFPGVRVLEAGQNLGFSRANNLALRQATTPYALILNSDAEVLGGSVEALLRVIDARPDVGIVGPKTRDTDGTLQVSFGPALGLLREWTQRRLVRAVAKRDAHALERLAELTCREHEPDWVSGSCMLARVEALRKVGYFDERFFLYEEDVDLCVRVRAVGWRVLFTPEAEITHHQGRSVEHVATRARLEYERSHLLYYRKHKGVFTALVLAGFMALRACGDWLLAVGPGPDRRVRRRHATQRLRITWHDPRRSQPCAL